MVEQPIIEAAVAILAIDVNFFIAYTISIKSKFDACAKERRTNLSGF
jgi:hypothetical protein